MEQVNRDFTIQIPEKFIEERVNQLVAYKMRHEKLQTMIRNSVVSHLSESLTKIKQGVSEMLLTDLRCNLQEQRDAIIEAFMESKRTVVNLDNRVFADVSDVFSHKELPNLLKFLGLFQQAMIVGPTGSGKSTLAKQAADAMDLRFGSFSCNIEASKSELLGFAGLNGYIQSSFLDFYENGGLFLIDEYDAMSSAISVVLNAAFDRSGMLSVPNRTEKPIAKKHEDFYCVLAGNTWGTGSIDYNARESQDKAFLDRFKMCRVQVDYDADLERNIAKEHYDFLTRVRKYVDDKMEGEKFSTRSFYDFTVLAKNGFEKKYIMEMMTLHWDSTMKDLFMRDFSHYF